MNNDFDHNQEREDEFLNSDPDWNSPIRVHFRGSLLGNYLDTRNPRYLLAFLLYVICFGIFISLLVQAFTGLNGGEITAKNSHGLWSKFYYLLLIMSALFSSAQMLAERYTMGFRMFLLTGFIGFLVYMRP